MKQRIFLFLICLIHVLALFPKSADRFFSQYNFKFITENAGLPYSFVSDIFKDSGGYVWVATHYGIGRYDGYQFLNYGTQTEPIRLKNDFVHKICEDNFRRMKTLVPFIKTDREIYGFPAIKNCGVLIWTIREI